MNIEDLDNLKHMLGVSEYTPKRQWGYRNYFACGKTDELSMERLVEAKYAERGHAYGDSFYYHATPLGAKLLKIPKKRIQELFRIRARVKEVFAEVPSAQDQRAGLPGSDASPC
jgi:hypothetical protein